MVGSGTPGEPEADGVEGRQVEIRAGRGGPREAAAIASCEASWHVRGGAALHRDRDAHLNRVRSVVLY